MLPGRVGEPGPVPGPAPRSLSWGEAGVEAFNPGLGVGAEPLAPLGVGWGGSVLDRARLGRRSGPDPRIAFPSGRRREGVLCPPGRGRSNGPQRMGLPFLVTSWRRRRSQRISFLSAFLQGGMRDVRRKDGSRVFFLK